jgi:hypothetical protein
MLEDLYKQITDLCEEFTVEHEAHLAGNKAAGRRARKAIGEVKKLITDYKKASVAKDKG